MRQLIIVACAVIVFCQVTGPLGASAQSSGNIDKLGRCLYGDANEITVEGDFAYVAAGDAIVVYNVSNPRDPIFISDIYLPSTSWKSTMRMVVQDGFIYTANRENGLGIIDVQDPENPVKLAQYYPYVRGVTKGIWVKEPSFWDIHLVDDYIIALDRYNGIRIIDVSVKTDPKDISYRRTGGWTEGLYVDNNFSYSTVGSSFHIINIKDKTDPFKISDLETRSWGKEIFVRNDTLYLIGGNYVSIADIQDRKNPSIISELSTQHFTNDGFLYDSFIFTTTSEHGLLIINVKNSSNPYLVTNYRTNSVLGGIHVANDIAYVAAGHEGLQILYVSDLRSPIQLGKALTGDECNDVVITDGFTYVAEGRCGLAIVNTSTASDPRLTTRIATEDAKTILIDGSTLYLADGEGGLKNFNITNPDGPELLDHENIDGVTKTLTVVDHYLYVGVSTGRFDSVTHIYNISDPADMQLVLDIELTMKERDYYLSVDLRPMTRWGDHLYVLSYDGAASVNISDRIDPIVNGSFDPGGYRESYAIAASQGYLYSVGKTENKWTASGNQSLPYGFGVHDLSNPSDPIPLAEIALKGDGFDIAIHGNFAFVATRYGLEVIDISAKDMPKEVGWYKTPLYDFGIRGPSISYGSDTVQIVDIDRGLLLFDVSAFNDSFRPMSRIVSAPNGSIEYLERLSFIGEVHSQEQIIAYEWRSSIDGVISNKLSFNISEASLSSGDHVISFRVQNNDRMWSFEESVLIYIGETHHLIRRSDDFPKLADDNQHFNSGRHHRDRSIQEAEVQ